MPSLMAAPVGGSELQSGPIFRRLWSKGYTELSLPVQECP